jgi:hypothetical protein
MSITPQHAPLSRFECELCSQQPAEFFIQTPWGERHICAECAESLPREDPVLAKLPMKDKTTLRHCSKLDQQLAEHKDLLGVAGNEES